MSAPGSQVDIERFVVEVDGAIIFALGIVPVPDIAVGCGHVHSMLFRSDKAVEGWL